MTSKLTKTGALLDLGLLASLITFIVVLINKDALPAPLAIALLFGLAVTASVTSLKREAHREGQLDEVELAGASFGARWGVAAVGAVALLLLFLTPFQNAIAQFAALAENSNGAPMPTSARLFLLGLVTAMAIQLIAKSALSAIWKRTKR